MLGCIGANLKVNPMINGQLNIDLESEEFDYVLCRSADGWAHLITDNDAPDYGNWVNPFKREMICLHKNKIYCLRCENDNEFKEQLKNTLTWHNPAHPRIDCQNNKTIRNKLNDLGFTIDECRIEPIIPSHLPIL